MLAKKLLQKVNAVKVMNESRSIKKVNLEDFFSKTLLIIDPLFRNSKFDVLHFLQNYPFTSKNLRDLNMQV